MIETELAGRLERLERAPDCGGCYSVGMTDGGERFLHPPRVSEDWKGSLARWAPKGPIQ